MSFLAVAGLAGTAARVAAATQPAWPVTVLRDASFRAVEPSAINDNGDITGRVDTGAGAATIPQYAGVYTVNGSLRTLPNPPGRTGALSIQPQAINNDGDVVGYYQVDGTAPYAFYFHAGVMEDLTTGFGVATGINNAGQISGYDENGGFLRNPDGSVVHLPAGTYPLAINASGHLVGVLVDPNNPSGPHPAFFFNDANHNGQVDSDELHTLQLPVGATFNESVALNDSDKIVGSYVDANGQKHAVVWANGQIGTNPVDLPGSPNAQAEALGINNAGDVVGNGPQGATLWPKGGQPVAVGQHVVNGPFTPQLQFLGRINNSGKALGTAFIRDDAHPTTAPVGVIITTQNTSTGGGGGNTSAAKLTTLKITPATVDGSQPLTLTVTFNSTAPAGTALALNLYSGPSAAGAPLQSFPITLGNAAKSYRYTVSAADLKSFIQAMPSGVTQFTAQVVGLGGEGQTNPAKVTVKLPPAPALSALSITPNKNVDGTQPLTIKIGFTQVVPTGTQVQLNFYAGAAATGNAVQSFTVTQNTTSSTNKTYSVSLPTAQLQALLNSLPAGTRQMTAQVVGAGTLGKTNAVTLDVKLPLAPLQLTGASVNPQTVSKSGTSLKAIKLSLQFNRLLDASEKSVVVHLTISVPQVGTFPYDVTVTPSKKQTSSTYSITGDKIKNFGLILQAPTGTYQGTAAYGGSTVPFSFTLNN